MKGDRYPLIRIAAAVVSAALVLCVFSSCSIKKEEDPEVTRGTVQIVAPIHTETEYHGEATTDPDATKSRSSTTSSSGKNSTTAPAATEAQPIVTFPSAAENEAVSQAASSGGTSVRDLAEFISVMGYDYDPRQDIFYTSLDNWQRQGNFVAHYDTAAHYINMNYKTIRIDFGPSEGLNWRMQLWKGEYGVFGGCEAGIYTADPDKNAMLYSATDNDHMLQWESALYLSRDDFKNNKIWFYREWQSHWWLTGFKSGVVNPEDIVMFLHVRMRSSQMANQFEEALISSGYKKLPNGSFLMKDAGSNLEPDSFKRSLNDFYIAWEDLGELNYSQRTGS